MRAETYDITTGDKQLRVLLADWFEHESAVELAEGLYNRMRHELTVADIVVIRPCVFQQIQAPESLTAQLEPVFERVAKLPVHVLASYQFRVYLSPNLHPGLDDITDANVRESVVRALADLELYELAGRTGAILRAEGPTVFRAPSQKYCRWFLRAGNVQTSRRTLDTIFFWLLPWLNECGAILIDSWSISSIALNAARLLARYELTNRHCEVEMLGHYMDGSPEADGNAREVLDRLNRATEGKVLALFSACMTGNAVRHLRQVVDEQSRPEIAYRYLTLFAVEAGIDIDALCQLHRLGTVEFRHLDDLPEDQGAITIIDIDPTTYFPTKIVEETVRIDARAAQSGRQFFDDYHRSGAFFVHRNSYLDGKKFRHHAIYSDLSVLLHHPTFTERFRARLEALDTIPRLILTPPHDAGIALAEVAAEVLGPRATQPIPRFVHLDLNFGRHPNAEEESLRRSLGALGDDDAILIMDDVSVTGGRLSRYSKGLRDLYRGQAHYFVGLARPANLKDWQTLTRNLRYRRDHERKHTISYVEFLLLPDWDERDCPWCQEEAIYRRIALSSGELPAALATRVGELSADRIDRGHRPPLFLNPVDSLPMHITQNSIFVNEGATEEELFTAVASAIQQLRTEPDATRRLRGTGHPVARRISFSDYLGNTFTDGVIRAAILRAARRDELEHVNAEDEARRAQLMGALMCSVSVDEHCVSAELALGSALRRLPKPAASHDHLRQSLGESWHSAITALLSARNE